MAERSGRGRGAAERAPLMGLQLGRREAYMCEKAKGGGSRLPGPSYWAERWPSGANRESESFPNLSPSSFISKSFSNLFF